MAPLADQPIHATSRRTLRSAGRTVIRCSAPRAGDQRALDHPAASGHVFDDVDIERLSPLGGDHITLTGRYRITLQSPYATAAAHRSPEHDPRDDRRLTRVPYELCVDILWQAGPGEPRDLDQVVLEAEAYRRLSYTWHSYQPEPQSRSAGRRSA